jgi:phosphoglycolate phosphatase
MRAIIFDLDGTLVDTAPDLAAAMNAVLREAGRPGLPLETIRHLVGRGARALIGRGFQATGKPADPADMEGHVESFLSHYRANIETSVVFPGVAETLAQLRCDARLGVCTSKPQEFAEMILAKLGIARHFGAVIGAGATAKVKPNQEHYFHVVRSLGADVRRSVMVGDSVTDVELARAAEVPVVLVSYGYTPEPAHALGADTVVDGFAELPAVIGRLLP